MSSVSSVVSRNEVTRVTEFRSGRDISIALQCGHYEGLGVSINVPEYTRESLAIGSDLSATKGCRCKSIPIPPPDLLWSFFIQFIYEVGHWR